jgi:hypothetical protein
MTVMNWERIKSTVLHRLSDVGRTDKTSIASISPYDIPEAFRVSPDPVNHSILVIEFKYTTEEPLEPGRRVEGITLRVGKNSGRLYKIEIDAKSLNPGDMVRLKFSDDAGIAIDRLVADNAYPKRSGNYRIAKQLLQDEELRNLLQYAT